MASPACADWVNFSVNQAVPDNDEIGLADTQTLTGFGNYIQSIEVRLKLTAQESDLAFNGDFYVTLQHESGLAVLLNRAGRTATLSSFEILNGNDSWTIFVADLNANGNAVFESWGLNITTIRNLRLWTCGRWGLWACWRCMGAGFVRVDGARPL